MTYLRRHLLLLGIGLLLAALLFALDVFATYRIFTSQYPGANDFYSRWGGARAFWVNGLNPYSDEATLLIQLGIYGRPARPDEDPGPFAYPFYVAILIWPLVYLPYPWASAIWLVLLEFSLLAATFLIISMYRWRPPLWLAAFSAIWVIIFYHGARTIILGQVAGLVFLFLALALWALHRRADGLAGVSLALCTIKPQMIYLVIPVLLWWAWRQHRRRVVGYFAATLAILAGLSFLLLPSWPLDFLRQLVTYNSYQALGYSNQIGSPAWIISHVYLPVLGNAGEAILVALLLAYTGYAWLAYRQRPQAFHWLVGLTLLTTNFITPRAATTNYIVLLLPVFLFFVALSRRSRHGHLWVLLLQLAGLAGLWLLFSATIDGNLEGPELYLPLPLLVLGGLLLYRRQFIAESPAPVPALQSSPG
jgi:hypothetical protein